MAFEHFPAAFLFSRRTIFKIFDKKADSLKKTVQSDRNAFSKTV
jgi:hypothetical protein